ncbi:response regulator [Natrinema sp. HArc-T2]|uniref:response regulator n=1 Tax=Natrinema sp. HArc-T2 TaxID=3242701 RepID=UPI00359E33E7
MSPQSASETASILLVEDNPGDVRLIQEAFGAAGFEATFHTVGDGSAALEFLRAHADTASGPTIDLMLLDLNLPRTDGFEVLEAINDERELAPLPVIVLTSSEATEDIRKSYERCANAYLTKPSDPAAFAELGRAIEEFWIDEATLPSVFS